MVTYEEMSYMIIFLINCIEFYKFLYFVFGLQECQDSFE